jgi:hypothetical protein
MGGKGILAGTPVISSTRSRTTSGLRRKTESERPTWIGARRKTEPDARPEQGRQTGQQEGNPIPAGGNLVPAVHDVPAGAARPGDTSDFEVALTKFAPAHDAAPRNHRAMSNEC